MKLLNLEDIPVDPNRTYKKEGWISFGDWLGTDNVAHGKIQYIPFKDARKFARSLKLKSVKEWRAYCRSGKKPSDIPTAVTMYKEWISWHDFLGYGPSKKKKKS